MVNLQTTSPLEIMSPIHDLLLLFYPGLSTDKRERGDDGLNAIDELKLTADVLVIGGGPAGVPCARSLCEPMVIESV